MSSTNLANHHVWQNNYNFRKIKVFPMFDQSTRHVVWSLGIKKNENDFKNI